MINPHNSPQRPHRSLPRQATPATAYAARPKATPGDRSADTHDRGRTDRIDNSGVVTLRHHGRLHHIGIGRTHARTCVIMLIQDLHIRVINAATGELLRELTLDPDRNYQPTGRPPARQEKHRDPNAGSRCPDVMRHHTCEVFTFRAGLGKRVLAGAPPTGS